MRQSRTITHLHRLLVLVAFALALGACGDEGADAGGGVGTEPLDGVGTEAAPARVPPVVDDAPVDEVSTALPQWFPEDAFLPAGYVVADINESFGARQVEMRLDGDIADLAAQVRAGMLAAGWAETHFSAPDGTRGSNMHFTKDTRGVTLSMSAGDDGGVRLVYGFTLPEASGQ